ncbi:MAG: hypothetical protein MJK15_17900 [Colwellia sp.]|nr:hypothetical protein [Colwellia sp.]
MKNDENTLAKNTEEPKTKNNIGYECKNIAITGTRIKKRICSTAAQRKAREEKGQDFHRHMQISGSIGERAN